MISEGGKQQLRLDEGVRLKVYLCTEGFRTVGVGFNMDSEGARARFNRILGCDNKLFDDVREGRAKLTDGQVNKLFDSTMQEAFTDAASVLGGSVPLWQYPQGAQDAITNLAFNLGRWKLSKFTKFLRAFRERNWPECAVQIKDSLWWKQVGDTTTGIDRGERLVNIFNNLRDK